MNLPYYQLHFWCVWERVHDVSMYVHMCVQVPVPENSYMESRSGHPYIYHSLSYFLRQVLSLNFWLSSCLCRLTSQHVPSISYLPGVNMTGWCWHTWLSVWVLGLWTHIWCLHSKYMEPWAISLVTSITSLTNCSAHLFIRYIIHSLQSPKK